jgi:hypothetical protein
MNTRSRSDLWRLKSDATIHQRLNPEDMNLLEIYLGGDREERVFAACVIVTGALSWRREQAKATIVGFVQESGESDPLLALVVCEALQFIREPEDARGAVKTYLRAIATDGHPSTQAMAENLLRQKESEDEEAVRGHEGDA